MRRLILRKTLTLLVVSMSAFAFNSCIFNAEEGTPPGPPPVPTNFKDLKARDDVLFNIRKAYNDRNPQQYDRLLDANFSFFFSNQDVIDGKVQAASWDRAAELQSAQHMFDRTFDPAPIPGNNIDPPPIGNISLTLNFLEGKDAWNEQRDDIVHPGEIWYEQTVSYSLVVIAGEFTFTNAQPINASFVIRFTEVGGDSIYRLVSWKDGI